MSAQMLSAVNPSADGSAPTPQEPADGMKMLDAMAQQTSTAPSQPDGECWRFVRPSIESTNVLVNFLLREFNFAPVILS